MPTKTSNFEYTKPGVDEFYDVTEYNQTLDKIDADMKALKDTEENHTDNATVHVTAEDKESWNTSLENKTLTYTESSTIQDLNSGEKLSVAFGKLKKAVNAVKNHTGTKATTSVQGHVKLSNSSAVTDSTGFALPTTEKNASIEGTLANQISAIKYKSFSYEANGLTAYFRKVGRLIDCYIQGQAVQELATASGYATVCVINDDDFKVHPNCTFIQYVFLNNVHYGQCQFTTETALAIGYTKNMSGTSTNIAEGEYIYIHFQYLSKQ